MSVSRLHLPRRILSFPPLAPLPRHHTAPFRSESIPRARPTRSACYKSSSDESIFSSDIMSAISTSRGLLPSALPTTPAISSWSSNTAGPVIPDREAALDRRSRSLLVLHDEAGHFLEHRVELREIVRLVAGGSLASALGRILGKLVGSYISALRSDELGDALDLGRIDERALHADQIVARRYEHIAATDQLVRSRLVDDRARVDHRRDAERDAGREIGL